MTRRRISVAALAFLAMVGVLLIPTASQAAPRRVRIPVTTTIVPDVAPAEGDVVADEAPTSSTPEASFLDSILAPIFGSGGLLARIFGPTGFLAQIFGTSGPLANILGNLFGSGGPLCRALGFCASA